MRYNYRSLRKTCCRWPLERLSRRASRFHRKWHERGWYPGVALQDSHSCEDWAYWWAHKSKPQAPTWGQLNAGQPLRSNSYKEYSRMSSLGIITLYSYSDWNIGKKKNVTSNMAKSHPGSTGSVECAIILQIFFLRSGDGYWSWFEYIRTLYVPWRLGIQCQCILSTNLISCALSSVGLYPLPIQNQCCDAAKAAK